MTKIQLTSVVETEPKFRRLREKVMTRNILVNRVCREIIQYLTNREALAVLCSVIKHAGSG